MRPSVARARRPRRPASHCRRPRPCACGRRRDAPDQQIVRTRLEDQHAVERAVALREIDLVLGEDLRIVRQQRQRLDAEDRAVLRIGRALAAPSTAARSSRSRTPQRAHAASPVERGQAHLLPALRVEILRASQRSNAALRAGHSRIDDRIPGGVAVLALHHLMLAEQALILEAEAQRRALGRLVAVVALPFVAPVAEREAVVAASVDRLGRGAACAGAHGE